MFMSRFSTLIITALAVIGATLSGCSSDDSSAAPATVTKTITVTATTGAGSSATTVSTSSPAAQSPNGVGQTFTNRGATVTFIEATAAGSIKLNQSNYRADSPNAVFTDTPARAGAQYIVVKTHIVNNAKLSMDLTCSLPINTRLLDDQNRQFDPIDGLYKIEGNPECNSQLQPGFEADMTWIYEVPTTATIVAWGFEELTDPSTLGTNRPTMVPIQLSK
jgi:hypothetical protein